MFSMQKPIPARPNRGAWLVGAALLVALVLAACQPVQPMAPEATQPAEEEQAAADDAMALVGDPEAGAYVPAMAAGCGCHFNRDLGALAGGNSFEGDYGIVYARNLTPDATGIGGLTDEQLIDAIRFGVSPNEGEHLFIMPRLASLSDQDAMDLVAYLRSLDPVENEVPARELAFDPPAFEVQQAPPAVAPTEGVDRGRYIASLTRCGRCHTPSNDDGSPNMDLFLAGAPFRDTVAPNITPDELTGLGAWSDEEIVEFLATGIYSDGTESHGGMKGIVDRGTGQLTDDDRLAIVAFLRSIPAVENLPEAVE